MLSLEGKTYRPLADAGGTCGHNLSEVRRSQDSAHGCRPKELRVIEDVEGLKPELKSLLVFERNRLLQGHIEARLTWTIERVLGSKALERVS